MSDEIHGGLVFSGKTFTPYAMVNEELITILSYISYNNFINKSIDEILGFFQRQDRITCRIKNKSALGEFLIDLDNLEMERIMFLDSGMGVM